MHNLVHVMRGVSLQQLLITGACSVVRRATCMYASHERYISRIDKQVFGALRLSKLFFDQRLIKFFRKEQFYESVSFHINW